MAIRSLDDIWVDANFKETELRDLRIGQAVDLHVDMYGSRQVFKGRVAGFTMGTGSTLALLPAQNATGNFVKVVQRLPVRIELEGYNPDKEALFIGISVVPYVYTNKPPTGPDAGKFLQSYAPQSQPPARLRARRPLTNDCRGTFSRQIECGEESVVSGRGSRRADVHGGARHRHRGGRAALYRRWPVGYRR
jgi:membrane fusion protein, multidrug efflux system